MSTSFKRLIPALGRRRFLAVTGSGFAVWALGCGDDDDTGPSESAAGSKANAGSGAAGKGGSGGSGGKADAGKGGSGGKADAGKGGSSETDAGSGGAAGSGASADSSCAPPPGRCGRSA